MPNWIYNNVVITNPDGRPVQTPTLDEIRTTVANPDTTDTDKRLLDFERIIPTGTDDVDIQRRAWGVKWGACNVQPTPNGWKFSTPWDYPATIYTTLSARFPMVRFVVTTTTETPTVRCRYTYENGERIKMEYGKMSKDKNGRPTPYNGWRNYETWCVALWLTGDPDAYELCKRHRYSGNIYADVAVELNKRGITHTPDGVAFWAPELDTNALDEMLNELP
jgi:hypothetical protein